MIKRAHCRGVRCCGPQPLSVFSFGGSPTSQDAPTPVQPAADEVVEIKVAAPAPEPAVEVKKEEEPKPAPAKACCAVC